MALSNAAQAELNGERIYSDSQVVYAGFTLAQLRTAFEATLAPGQNWKDEIRTLASAEDRELVVAAIEFHVGGPTTVESREFTRAGQQVTMLTVTNAGYYVNVGA